MFTILSILFVLATIYLLAFLQRRALRGRLTFAANIGEGFHDDGRLTLFPDAAITSRYLLVKFGSDGSHIAIAGAADIPLGICTDSTDVQTGDITKPLTVNVLGAVRGTQRGVAAGVIVPGAFISPAANGQVQTLPATTGTYYIIGRYVGTVNAAANTYAEFTPCLPTQRIVP